MSGTIYIRQKRKRCRFHWVHRESNLLFKLERQQQRQRSKKKNYFRFRSDINEP